MQSMRIVLMAVQMKSLCFCDLGSAHFDRCEVSPSSDSRQEHADCCE